MSAGIQISPRTGGGIGPGTGAHRAHATLKARRAGVDKAARPAKAGSHSNKTLEANPKCL
jgi:hypothetical protein